MYTYTFLMYPIFNLEMPVHEIPAWIQFTPSRMTLCILPFYSWAGAGRCRYATHGVEQLEPLP